jgi:hypothetical protein
VPRKSKAASAVEWTESERERRARVEAGEAVVANMRTDDALIAWAKAEGLYVRIDRRSVWGNPFVLGADGDRDAVIAQFAAHIRNESELLERVAELRGKVLGCWCHPEPCHGCVLIELVQESPGEHFACGRLRRSRSDGARGIEEVR